MRTFSFIALLLLVVFIPHPSRCETLPPVDSRHWTNKFDRNFKKYTKRYFGPGFEWKWFKAQAIAESNLKSDARSWANAKGIMQVLPKTFNEIKKKNPSFVDINEPRWNIAAGIYYDKTLFKKWKAPRPFIDRMKFTFGSYNAGFGTIVKAQKSCKKKKLNENLWHNIRIIAHTITEWRHEQTIDYVAKINRLMRTRVN